VVAALPKWRDKVEQMAKGRARQADRQVKLLRRWPGAEDHGGADNYAKHVERCRKSATPFRAWRGSRRTSRRPASSSSPTPRWSAVGKAFQCASRIAATIMRPSSLIIGKQGATFRRKRRGVHRRLFARLDIRRAAGGPELSESIDGYTVLGPVMITADELPKPADVRSLLHVNDEKRQDATPAS